MPRPGTFQQVRLPRSRAAYGEKAGVEKLERNGYGLQNRFDKLMRAILKNMQMSMGKLPGAGARLSLSKQSGSHE